MAGDERREVDVTRRVAVIGAGLSGLCCARNLQRAGIETEIFEASDGVGGRVRTDVIDGCRVDRGFQVLFTAYPAVKHEIDLGALKLQAFEPGAIIYHEGHRHILADPIRVPGLALQSALSTVIGLGDKLKVPQLGARLGGMSVDEIFAMPDQTMEAYLKDFGFSQEFLDRFMRPFFAGIFLEMKMETSARMFAFVFKMLAEGQTTLPENGMGTVGEQLAEALKPGSVHLNSPVRELIRRGDRVAGVLLADGTSVAADAVVVATEADRAARLTGLPIEVEWRQSVDVVYSLPESLYEEKLLTLHADGGMLVNNFSQVTNAAPSYAPAGRHLLSATIVGNPALSEEEIDTRTRTEVSGHFPKAHPNSWELLQVRRVTWAQYAQPPGTFDRRPTPETGTPGLVLAGEITSSSSLHGALLAGQRAAAHAMREER